MNRGTIGDTHTLKMYQKYYKSYKSINHTKFKDYRRFKSAPRLATNYTGHKVDGNGEDFKN